MAGASSVRRVPPSALPLLPVFSRSFAARLLRLSSGSEAHRAERGSLF